MALDTAAKLRPRLFFWGSKDGSTSESDILFVSPNTHRYGVASNQWPANASNPSPGMSGVALTSYQAGGYQTPAYGGGVSTYLTEIFNSALASAPSSTIIYDRLWHNSGIVVTTTTAQAINSVAWPARDKNGSTNGEDVMIALETGTSANTNAGKIANCTLDYTNSNGDPGRTATITNINITKAIGNWAVFELQSGDTGVRSIQNITLGTSLVAGSVFLVAFRVIAMVAYTPQSRHAILDALSMGVPKLHDNTVLDGIISGLSFANQTTFANYRMGFTQA